MLFDVLDCVRDENGPGVDHDVQLEPCGVVLVAVQVFKNSEEDSAHEVKSQSILDNMLVLFQVIGGVSDVVDVLQAVFDDIQKGVHMRC